MNKIVVKHLKKFQSIGIFVLLILGLPSCYTDYGLTESEFDIVAAGFIDLFDDASGHGCAEIMNLNIEAVPVPPTLLLLGSGLIVLVSFKRKSQKI